MVSRAIADHHFPSTLCSLTSGNAISRMLVDIGEKAQAEGTTREAMTARSQAFRHIPPHVADATTGPEAYPIRRLIPESAWDAVDSSRLLTAAENDDVLQKLTDYQAVSGGTCASCLWSDGSASICQVLL